MNEQIVKYHDQDALLYRLNEGLESSDKEVVFVVGAPLTAPTAAGRGVADVAAVVNLVRSRFGNQPAQLAKFDAELLRSPNKYQAAFDFLAGRASQDAANQIIKRAVASALISAEASDWDETISRLSEQELGTLDRDNSVWHLNAALLSLGGLIARYPKRFGNVVVTSNFDPLVEVAIRTADGQAWRTSLSGDGSIFQSTAPGCQVVHIHGYWHGTDTLHTNRQLIRARPTLTNDFLSLLHNKIVVVVAYGGWPDIFTGALAGIVGNENLFPDVLWTFFSDEPVLSEYLYGVLAPGIERYRVTLYKGIDCHSFFPELLSRLDESASSHPTVPALTTDQTQAQELKAGGTARLFRLAPLECDRPPNVDVWVGREREMRALETSNAKVVIVCGMGGEGKSVLASHYIHTLSEHEGRFRLWDWRDCKEQSDRIRTQVVEIIVRFSAGRINAEDLLQADDEELVEVLIDRTSDAYAVLVFDNVDSYIDLENQTCTGLLDVLVQRVAASSTTSRLLLTCRPDVHYLASSVITFSMKGVSDDEAIELFSKRAPGHSIPEEDIREAHTLTKGHAFWLDLLAVQVTQVPGTTLKKLLQDMRRGREDGPDVLSSIWDKLALREKTLLRFMAEAVRPETEKVLEQFVVSQLSFKNFSKALRSLTSLNLIVVKPESDAPDLYDLHPLVRQFVRRTFAPAERFGFIRIVISQYDAIIGAIEALLGIHLPLAMLERWSQKAELQVSAGLYGEAFETLSKIQDAFIGGGHVQEYVRVARKLFEAIDWETAPARYKQFDHIVGTIVAALDQLDDLSAADSLMQRLEATIPQKTARFIKFCDIRSHSCWLRGQFDPAIEWASKGVALKTETNVDTDFDCGHNLALAQRDAGHPEAALKHFLRGHDAAEFTGDNRPGFANGPMYGNIGRCFQLMDRASEALQFYKKSMALLENDSTADSKSNRAYARRWVGQVFASTGDFVKAEAFLMDAIRVLGSSSPVRVRQLYGEIESFCEGSALLMNESKAQRIVSSWMSD